MRPLYRCTYIQTYINANIPKRGLVYKINRRGQDSGRGRVGSSTKGAHGLGRTLEVGNLSLLGHMYITMKIASMVCMQCAQLAVESEMDGYTFALILFFATSVRTDCVIAAYSELLQEMCSKNPNCVYVREHTWMLTTLNTAPRSNELMQRVMLTSPTRPHHFIVIHRVTLLLVRKPSLAVLHCHTRRVSFVPLSQAPLCNMHFLTIV